MPVQHYLQLDRYIDTNVSTPLSQHSVCVDDNQALSESSSCSYQSLKVIRVCIRERNTNQLRWKQNTDLISCKFIYYEDVQRNISCDALYEP